MQATLTLADDDVWADAIYYVDADLARRVEDSLANSAYKPLRAFVCCTCRDAVVTLTGNLPSFYLKQIAQRIAMSVSGVEGVINSICVDGIP